MTSDPYGDADLVTLYDIDNPGGDDHAYYRALADRLDARTVIDLGCGTGLLTRSFCTPGRVVLGVDPSQTMIRFARQQPGAAEVRWICGGAQAIPDEVSADLVVCTGNAIQHIPDDELPAVFDRVASALRPGGVLSLDSRNPAARAWEQWTPDMTMGERQTMFGHLREWLEVTDVTADRRVRFDAHNIIDGGPDRVFTSVLHFRTASEFARLLTSAGFSHVQVMGTWNGGPVTDTSAVLVVRASLG